jgi:RimJ/RimL family protein N-acetyltransferase
MFDYVEERSESPALDMAYHLTPWDEPAFRGNTASVSFIRLRNETEAAGVFGAFRDWCVRNAVKLVACRLAQGQLPECGFLEAQGFRFIELNYRPSVEGLGSFSTDLEITVCPAAASDEAEISDFAGRIFQTGRLHVDPMIGSEIGNRRYALWASNAFRRPDQQVLKCQMADQTIAFSVVERPTCSSRFWSLIGLAPGLAGKGLGRRAWRAVLAFHHAEGVYEVSTSISSHNVAVHNLYSGLGFRFPAPEITLHWCPFGPVRPATP